MSARRRIEARGRVGQPPGRHRFNGLRRHVPLTPSQPYADGMYPVGQSLRVPFDVDTLEALERPNNDPHQRYTMKESTP